MSTKLLDLQKAALDATKTAREVAEKAEAESRSMTDAERANYDQALAKGRDLLDQIKVAKDDEALLAAAKSLAAEIGPLAEADLDGQRFTKSDPRSNGRKSLGQQVTESLQYKKMLDSLNIKGPSDRIPANTHVQSEAIAIKSLFTGGSSTSAGAFVVNEDSGIYEPLGRKELTIRDLVAVRSTGSDAVEYVRQTSHTNNAGPVAEATSSAPPTTGAALNGPLVNNPNGGYKPEGAWAFERDTAVVKTIAEWVPASKRAVADVKQLEGLINDELRSDVADAEEAQILLGDGTGENLPGIMTTTGRQMQAWVTDIFTTTRKAKTKAQTIGRVNPSAYVFSPEDVEQIDLARDLEGRFYAGGPFAAGQRTLWGIPYLASESMPTGRGLLGDFKKAVLWDREQTTVTMTDSHADFFIRNLVAILAEERVAFAVTRATAFVEIDTAA